VVDLEIEIEVAVGSNVDPVIKVETVIVMKRRTKDDHSD
jgi:hypothetical protein